MKRPRGGAGSGPAAWLARHVLGVTPASPGFGRVRVRPHLGDLTWARGKVPPPPGPVVYAAELFTGPLE